MRLMGVSLLYDMINEVRWCAFIYNDSPMKWTEFANGIVSSFCSQFSNQAFLFYHDKIT